MHIHEGVQRAIETIQALSEGSPTRPAALGLPGAESQSLEEIDEALKRLFETLDLHPKSEVDTRRQNLQNIAWMLLTRYDLNKAPADLDACIRYFRTASELHCLPKEGPHCLDMLTSFGTALRKRHALTGKLTDIDEAVKLHGDALDLLPSNHNKRYQAVFYLAIAVSVRGLRHSAPDDIELAIDYHNYAFTLWPTEDKDRYSPLYHVACAFMTRFEMSKNPIDLNESIQNYEAALRCIPQEHPMYRTLCHHRYLALEKRCALSTNPFLLNRPSTAPLSLGHTTTLTPASENSGELYELKETSAQGFQDISGSRGPPVTSPPVRESASFVERASISSLLSTNASISRNQNIPGAPGALTPSPSSRLQVLNKLNIFAKCVMPLEKFNTLVCSADCSLTSLHWYKEKDGVKHEFLVVQVTPTGGGDPVWIRLDRAAKRAHANTRRLRLWSDISSSKFLADDSASIWTEKADACGGTQCDETYSCKFPGQPPLRLERFAGLLKIFVEESPFYTLVKENCWFFCSTVTEVLKQEFHIVGESGSVAHLGLGMDVRRRVRERFMKEIKAN